eukprot:6476969-Amphidinium_carterae.1
MALELPLVAQTWEFYVRKMRHFFFDGFLAGGPVKLQGDGISWVSLNLVGGTLGYNKRGFASMEEESDCCLKLAEKIDADVERYVAPHPKHKASLRKKQRVRRARRFGSGSPRSTLPTVAEEGCDILPFSMLLLHLHVERCQQLQNK